MTLDPQMQQVIELRIANERKSMFVAYLLWFLLGVIGAHRVYLESPVSAFFMALMFFGGLLSSAAGVPLGGAVLLSFWGIWMLIDVFLIPAMGQERTRRLRNVYLAEAEAAQRRSGTAGS